MKSISQILYELVHFEESAAKERQMKDDLENLIDQMYSSGILYSEAVREFKKRFILRSLKERRGNQCKTARELGLHRNTLSRTIMELKMQPDVEQLMGHMDRKVYARSKPVQPAALAATAGVKLA